VSDLSQRKAVLVFAAFAFAYFLSTLIRAITATLAPNLVEEFSLNASDLGLLAGGYFLGFAATQLPLGTWLDRFGPKKVLMGFLSIAVLACIAFSMATSFAGLLLARLLCGVGVSACLMAPLTGYRRWYAPTSQMRANSWMLMIGALGMVASTLPVQWLMPIIGWRSIFLWLGASVALAVALIVWQVPNWNTAPRKPASQTESTGYAEVWRHPYFRKMAPLGFFNFGGLVAMQTLWAAPWMVKVAAFSPLQAATGLFWINIAMLLAFWLWGLANPWLARQGYTADRLITYGIPVSLVLFAIITIAGYALSTSIVVILILFFVSSTVGALAQPAVGLAFRPELAGRALSAFNLVIFSGVFTVQWGIGLLVDGLRALGWAEPQAYQGAFGAYGLCCVGAYVYFLLAKKP
jgi:predicted MFS family arabinose efflux permease